MRKTLDGIDDCTAALWHPLISSSLMFCMLSAQTICRRRFNKLSAFATRGICGVYTTHGNRSWSSWRHRFLEQSLAFHCCGYGRDVGVTTREILDVGST